MSSTNGKFDTAKQDKFLKAYAVCGNITWAAKTAGTARQSHHKWMRSDPTYPERFKEAKREAADRLEAEARRRAVEGVKRAVVQKGEVVFAWFDAEGNIVDAEDERAVRRGPVMEHAYSDRLLEVLLRANLPSKYRERTEVTHRGGMEVRIESKEQKLARVQSILDGIRSRLNKPKEGDDTWSATDN